MMDQLVGWLLGVRLPTVPLEPTEAQLRRDEIRAAHRRRADPGARQRQVLARRAC
ncbi:hypothetical protein LI90_1449 [Carbonactinospora thermoautotrophica]|uniref:Uncharacterized protein n=1 Tax=Carbonactinospora thermoautotrophica TaxID=1469144 RepID=A0A132MPM9_9ACTN|nr:hypothetical protein LI90_1449 [Carbonactinospora thermoautotrophica]